MYRTASLSFEPHLPAGITQTALTLRMNNTFT